MREAFLHFIWETRSYYSDEWQTLEGDPIKVIDPGIRNQNQGPDFLHAKVELNGIEQYGHVEIHIDGRDWYNHRHQKDPNYNAVILHVVLSHSIPILREDGTSIPEVSLNGRIHAGLMQRSDHLAYASQPPSCGPLLGTLPEGVSRPWLRTLAAERLERKIGEAQAKLDLLQGDWEQAVWQELAGFMAGPVNKEAFLTLAEHLPFKVLRRYQSNPLSREALLFGTACLLSGSPKDEYMAALQAEWKYLSALHQIPPAPILLKMHRMRPANFPTIRIAQLGLLVSHRPRLVELLYPEHLEAFCDQVFQTSDYWQSHLRFGQISRSTPRKIGRATLRTILLNSLLPLAVLYAQAHGIRKWEGLSRIIPRNLGPENNRFIRAFRAAGIAPQDSGESQAMIRLYKSYCQPKRCLECGIGKWLLQR